jgi:DNA-binding transcriptional ArsR family regulator
MQKKCACSHCLSNLAVDSRLIIFDFLKKSGRQTVSKIVAQTTLSQPTISYHLKQMLAAGLLEQQRDGRSIYYQVKVACPHHHDGCVLKKMEFYVED